MYIYKTADMKRIPWVKGNTLNLSVPLQLVTVNNGQSIKTDYMPPEGSEIHVCITGRFGGKEYPYTISDNVVSFKDDGTLQVGCYGVEITVSEPQTHQVNGQNRRTFKQDIEIFNSLDELGVIPDGEFMLDAAIFIQGQKGDRGDPFTYEDFTPEQIEGLKKPAYDAAAEVAALEQSIEAAEALRVEAERGRVDAEASRVLAEQGRVAEQQADHAQYGLDHAQQQADHAQYGLDHTEHQADHQQYDLDHAEHQADHQQYGLDHQQQQSDHAQYGIDHQQQQSDHAQYGTDHQQQQSDHAQYGTDHQQYLDDHAQYLVDEGREIERQQSEALRNQAESERAAAESDRAAAENQRHAQYTTDHATAAKDHSTAVTDHSTAVSDHEDYEQAIGTINSKMDLLTEEQFNEIFT